MSLSCNWSLVTIYIVCFLFFIQIIPWCMTSNVFDLGLPCWLWQNASSLSSWPVVAGDSMASIAMLEHRHSGVDACGRKLGISWHLVDQWVDTLSSLEVVQLELHKPYILELALQVFMDQSWDVVENFTPLGLQHVEQIHGCYTDLCIDVGGPALLAHA